MYKASRPRAVQMERTRAWTFWLRRGRPTSAPSRNAWTGFKESVYRVLPQRFFTVRLWPQEDLIQQILTYFDQLCDTIQDELPVSRIWIRVSEDCL